MKFYKNTFLFLFFISLTQLGYSFDKDTMYLCKNDGINYRNTVTSGNPVAWLWSFEMGDYTSSVQQNPPPVFYNTAGIFMTRVSTTFDNGDIQLDSVIVVVKDWPMPRFYFPNDTGYCQNAAFPIQLNTINYPGAIYQWSTGATSPSITVNTPGVYWVNVLLKSDSRTCDSIYQDITVVEYQNPNVNLGNDRLMCQNQIIPIDAGAGAGYTYLWQPVNSTNRVLNVTLPGIYTVTVTNADGCTATDVIELRDSCPHLIFMPNAFSPNSDFLNDALNKVWNFTPKEFIFRTYNRWGELLFETRNLNQGWDGKVNDELAQQDIYVYQIQYLDTDNKWYQFQGTFYLVR